MARRRILYAPELLALICTGSYTVEKGTGVPLGAKLVDCGVLVPHGKSHQLVYLDVEHPDLEESEEPLAPVISALEIVALGRGGVGG